MMTVYKLNGNPAEKLGRHNGIYTKSYQLSKAAREAKIRNWEIEILERTFSVKDSNGEVNEVYFDWAIGNCGCRAFIENQSTTCMHIEAVRILLHREMIPIKEMKQQSIRYIDFKFDLQDRSGGAYSTPAVAPFIEYQEARAYTPYDPGTDNFDVFRDYDIKLKPFQLRSIERMLKCKRTILCLTMGLGKTLSALACCKILNRSSIIIVAPNSLKYQWQREINRFSLGSSLVIAKGTDLELYEDQRFLILSYEMLNRHHEILEANFDILIADEIQKVKNSDSVSWATMSRVKSEFLFALSGTPIQNSLSDLISVIDLLNPSELKPKWRFYDDYCAFSRAKLFGLRPDRIPQLRKRLQRYIINPKIENSGFKLPEKIQEKVVCDLTPDQKDIHDGCMTSARPLLAKSMHQPLKPEERAILNRLLTMARMASSDARLIEQTASKSHRFYQIENKIKEIIAAGEKVVVYSEWIRSLKLLSSEIEKEGVSYSMFNGHMTAKAKERSLTRFINDKKVMVLFATDSGGVGVDGLQLAANHVIHVERLWNPMKIEQRNGRLVRMLQPKDEVKVIEYLSDCEVENMIGSADIRKRDIIHSVLGNS